MKQEMSGETTEPFKWCYSLQKPALLLRRHRQGEQQSPKSLGENVPGRMSSMEGAGSPSKGHAHPGSTLAVVGSTRCSLVLGMKELPAAFVTAPEVPHPVDGLELLLDGGPDVHLVRDVHIADIPAGHKELV